MRLILVTVLASLWLRIGSSQMIVPNLNQTVAINSTENITYTCTTGSSFTPEWELRSIQLSPGSTPVTFLASNGIFIESMGQSTCIIVSREGRELFSNEELQLRCLALDLNPPISQPIFSDFVYIRPFPPPTVPLSFRFDAMAGITPGAPIRLVLTWEQPNNTIIDEDDPVITNYTVTATGPNANFVEVTSSTRFEFDQTPGTECSMHNFTVFATNDAGQGPSVSLTQTIPISPDITQLSQTLTVSRIALSSNGATEVDVTFAAAEICSPSFPLTQYIVTIMMGNQMESVMYPINDPRISGRESITVPVPAGGILQQDMEYSVTVSACIELTCRTSPPLAFRTTDVVSARITFFETNVFLECDLVPERAGLGCAFRLITSTGDNETLLLGAESGPSQLTLCTTASNTRNGYTRIEVVDWESDSPDVFGMLPIGLASDIVIEEASNYTMMTGCEPVVIGTPLSGGAIAGITIGVLLAVFIIITIVVVVAVVEYQRRHAKHPKMVVEDREKVVVNFDKDWLKENQPTRRISLRRGRSTVDGPEQASMAAAGPPDPKSPTLANPAPVFTLHIDRDSKKAQLQLNRALIRRVLQNTDTLERRVVRAWRQRVAQGGEREPLIHQAQSEIRVTGEVPDEDQRDGEDDRMIARL